ncbi:DUF1007 family protein [Dinoroseobacter sp. PD6]|uniref:DUF1007 family protein n=1 Tax=Dinoroseobacter sp. PD6 TaxID=3028384 RepID=UPI00237C1A14|nr:DUF1007 family protein [Dinoroseobacter sp. PD6]MDD9718241.1 DUF1007 family protein [Dinoroseobacter sp. PD6]
MKALRAFCAVSWLAPAWVAAASLPAFAHPHIFIDAGATLVFDEEGRLGAVRIVWAYDSLFSLVVVEEQGLDPDFDGVLEPGEAEQLSGFDMNWIEGFAGDSYLLAGGAEVPLTRPLEYDAAYDEGRVVSTHLRALETRVAVGAEPVILQIYDPTYYTSYEINLPVRLENAPEGCVAEVYVPDPEAASEQLVAALQEFAGSDDPLFEDDFPAVGDLFAHEVRVTCGP